MKMLIKLIGAIGLVAAVPALAESAPAPAPAATAKHYTTAETSIADLIADPAAKAILDRLIPGLTDNPQLAMVSSMTLRALQPLAADKITEESLSAVDAELSKLPAK